MEILGHANLVRLAIIVRDKSGFERPHVNIAIHVELPVLPQTLEFFCPIEAMDTDLTYMLALEFNEPVDLEIWDRLFAIFGEGRT